MSKTEFIEGELLSDEPIDVSKYEPKWHDGIVEQCENYASLGANYADMANMIGITQQTFIRWRKARPELEQAILRGRGLQQCNVSKALLHRALGKTKITEDRIVTATIGGKKVVTTTHVTKQLAPDVGAQKLWLEAHDPEKWGASSKLNAAERAAQIAADADGNRPTPETIVGAVRQLMQG